MRLAVISLLALCLFPGCRSCPVQPSTQASSPQWISDTLYFGLSMPRGQVSEEQWKQFLADTVTPRFPNGFTTWEARGQWKDAKGKVVQEPSRVLQIMHPDDASGESDLTDIISTYKNRFGQESVMRVKSPGKITF